MRGNTLYLEIIKRDQMENPTVKMQESVYPDVASGQASYGAIPTFSRWWGLVPLPRKPFPTALLVLLDWAVRDGLVIFPTG